MAPLPQADTYTQVNADRMSYAEVALNVFIVVLGFGLMVSSTYFTLIAF